MITISRGPPKDQPREVSEGKEIIGVSLTPQSEKFEVDEIWEFVLSL